VANSGVFFILISIDANPVRHVTGDSVTEKAPKKMLDTGMPSPETSCSATRVRFEERCAALRAKRYLS